MALPIADSITTFSNNLAFISSATKQAVVKPQNFEGIAGFLFDIPKREEINLSADITEHYIENNTVINDHIALKPETLTLEGFVGELKFKSNRSLPILGGVVDKLNLIDGFFPDITTQANQLYTQTENALNVANQAKKNTENIYGLFNDLDSSSKETKQAKAFYFFYALWQSREVFTVDTPWHVFTNMFIIDLKAMQEENNYLTNFSVTLKKIRFAENIQVKQRQGRNGQQNSKISNNGKTKGKTKPVSFLRGLF